jgi:hypothetical protein
MTVDPSRSDPRSRLGRKIGHARRSQFCSELAEGVRFELTESVNPRQFSRRTTRTAAVRTRT